MKIPKICVAFVFATISFVHAQESALDSLISKEVLLELESSNGRIERTYKNVSDFSQAISPNTEFSKRSATTWKNDSSKFASENLFLVKKSDLGGDNSLSAVSKIVRSISTMKGIQYYSNGDKKWETLYKDAYCIQGPKDRTRVPDDTEGNADGKILYCMQNDNSFGKTNYRLEYHQSQTEVSAAFVNTTGLYVGPIKGVDNNNLRINIVIMDCGDDMLIYMLVRAKFPALSILEKTMNESFSSRLDAIYKWFLEQF